jgi:UPF0271 protein
VTVRRIDLNADVGESEAAQAGGTEAALVGLVSSVNVACGGHAGTAATMAAVVDLALSRGVAVGAHPSYPDPEGFGRRPLAMSEPDLAAAIESQVRTLERVARERGARLRHVKLHGALYNVAARDPRVARVVAGALAAWRESLWLVGLAGSSALDVWREAGYRVAEEAFADRRYEPDGSLRDRRWPDALLTDPAEAAQQALDLALGRGVLDATGRRVEIVPQTLCIHGDTPGAAAIARAVRAALAAAGVSIAPLREHAPGA